MDGIPNGLKAHGACPRHSPLLSLRSLRTSQSGRNTPRTSREADPRDQQYLFRHLPRHRDPLARSRGPDLPRIELRTVPRCERFITTSGPAAPTASTLSSFDRWAERSTPRSAATTTAFVGEQRFGPINPADSIHIELRNIGGRSRSNAPAAILSPRSPAHAPLSRSGNRRAH